MVDIAHVKAHYGISQRCIHRTVDVHVGDGHQLFHTVACQFLLVLLDRVETDGVDIIDGLGQSVGGYIVGRTSLKLKRQALESGFLPRHLVDHLTPTLIWRQLLQPLLLAIEHANACRSIHLMAAEGEEVAVHRLHIHLEVRRTLGSVHQHGDAMPMGNADDLLNGIDGSQHITHMRHADDLGTVGNQRFQLICTKNAVIRDRDMLDDNPPFHGLKLPADDVRVVLHLRHDHLVAWLHLRFAE